MKVAIIDDDPIFRSLLRGLLEQLSIHAIVEGENGQDYYKYLQDEIDIYFLDINMPHDAHTRFDITSAVLDGVSFKKNIFVFSNNLNEIALIGLVEIGALGVFFKEDITRDLLLECIRKV